MKQKMHKIGFSLDLFVTSEQTEHCSEIQSKTQIIYKYLLFALSVQNAHTRKSKNGNSLYKQMSDLKLNFDRASWPFRHARRPFIGMVGETKSQGKVFIQ